MHIEVSLHEKNAWLYLFLYLSSSSFFLFLSFYRENILVTQSVSMCFQIGIISSLSWFSHSLSLSLIFSSKQRDLGGLIICIGLTDFCLQFFKGSFMHHSLFICRMFLLCITIPFLLFYTCLMYAYSEPDFAT